MPFFKLNSAKAVQYANTYLNKDNYFFKSFEWIEEEVSFVSQCILAGSDNQMCKNEDGWFYDSERDYSLSWIDGDKLFAFLLKTNCGPFGRIANESNLMIGDIVFLNNRSGEKHVGIITKSVNEEIFVSIKNKKFLECSLNSFQKFDANFIHLLGVKK